MPLDDLARVGALVARPAPERCNHRRIHDLAIEGRSLDRDIRDRLTKHSVILEFPCRLDAARVARVLRAVLAVHIERDIPGLLIHRRKFGADATTSRA